MLPPVAVQDLDESLPSLKKPKNKNSFDQQQNFIDRDFSGSQDISNSMPFGEIPENLKDSGVTGLNMHFAPQIQPKKKPVPKIIDFGE